MHTTSVLRNYPPLEVKRNHWKMKSISFDEKFLVHLCDADDIVIISADVDELVQMLKELSTAKYGYELEQREYSVVQQRISTDIWMGF